MYACYAMSKVSGGHGTADDTKEHQYAEAQRKCVGRENPLLVEDYMRLRCKLINDVLASSVHIRYSMS